MYVCAQIYMDTSFVGWWCICDFKADDSALDNQSGDSSLGEVNSPPSAVIWYLKFFV